LKLERHVDAEHSGGVEIDEELALQPGSILIAPRTKACPTIPHTC
jgi:hypothetical protein